MAIGKNGCSSAQITFVDSVQYMFNYRYKYDLLIGFYPLKKFYFYTIFGTMNLPTLHEVLVSLFLPISKIKVPREM